MRASGADSAAGAIVSADGPARSLTAQGETRGTQSFVHILAACWRRPSLLALELLWRWVFGIPLLALLAWEGLRIWSATGEQVRGTGIFEFSLQFPLNGALAIAESWEILRGPVFHALTWLLPVAVAAWSVAAGLGRNALVRRYTLQAEWRPGASIALQLLRCLALCGAILLWFRAIQWAAHVALAGASATADSGQGEPNLVLYCALVIVISLGLFTVWALLSWVFSIAPLLAVLEGRGVMASLRRSVRLGPLAGKLTEINMVMGIVKLALVVLAMVFSAVPLPFEAEVQGASLYVWWAVVTVLYLLASDLFQVARIAAFVELWGGLAVPAETSSAPEGAKHP